jgi:hypothetical protein
MPGYTPAIVELKIPRTAITLAWSAFASRNRGARKSGGTRDEIGLWTADPGARARHLLRERRSWVLNFGPVIARRLHWFRPRPSNRWHLDEMVVRIAGAKARFSTCWFRVGAILRGGLRQDEPVACPYLPLARDNLI